jgi:hypothetical protein
MEYLKRTASKIKIPRGFFKCKKPQQGDCSENLGPEKRGNVKLTSSNEALHFRFGATCGLLIRIIALK